MAQASPALDTVFHALGDPTRRAVIARLCRGPASVSDLAAPFRMALPSFVQHLDVLERSGLITSTKRGRVRTCEVRLEPLNRLERWMAQQRSTWERRMDQFDAYVKTLHEKEQNDG